MEMLAQPIYYAIFYDIDKPKNHYNAMNKRILEKQYFNLIDGLEGKEVELRSADGLLGKYRVVMTSTFHIFNSVDNHFFAIVDCKKIPKPSSIFK